MTKKLILAFVLFALTLFAAPARDTGAFCNEYTFLGIPLNCDGGGHPHVTRDGLSFLWPDVREMTVDAGVAQDAGDTNADDDRRHFDSCRLREAASYVNGRHNDVVSALSGPNPDNEAAIRSFGRLLHTVQDFYAHSDWIQLLGTPSGPVATQLVAGGTGYWTEFEPLGVIREDLKIMSGELPTDPDTGLPYLPDGYTISEPLDSSMPLITTPDQEEYRALVTGWNVPGRYPDIPGQEDDGDGACVDARPTTVCDVYGCPRTGKLVHGAEPDESPHPDCEGIDFESCTSRPCLNSYPTFVCLNHDSSGRPDFTRAYNSAVVQTQFEWCRLLNLLKDNAGDYHSASIPMALWVQDDEPGDASTPHPFGSACRVDTSSGVKGPIGVTVSVPAMQRATDLGPFPVVSSFVTYSGDFKDSSRTRSAPMVLDDDVVTNPVSARTLCLSASDTLAMTVQGWIDIPLPLFTTIGAWDASLEPAIHGVTLSFAGPTFGAGPHNATSDSISVDFNVAIETADADADGLPDLCGELFYGTDSSDPDTDDDGLLDGDETNTYGTDPTDDDSDDDGITDGTEVNGTNPTNPLDADSDDDGLSDGTEDANKSGGVDAGETNPNLADTDVDALTDGCEVTGTNPTNPLDADSDDDGLNDGTEDANHDCIRDATETNPNDADSDDDQLKDGDEVGFGTNPLDADTDDDGIQDGDDPDWLRGAIGALPPSVFKDKSTGLRTAMQAQLDSVEQYLIAGKVANAKKILALMRTEVNGCGTTADKNDWIVDCTTQLTVRGWIDLLIANVNT
jgi:hypothetical protein